MIVQQNKRNSVSPKLPNFYFLKKNSKVFSAMLELIRFLLRLYLILVFVSVFVFVLVPIYCSQTADGHCSDTFLQPLHRFALSWLWMSVCGKRCEKIWGVVKEWVVVIYYGEWEEVWGMIKPGFEFLNTVSILSVALIYAINSYLYHIAHDRRDYTDMMTISWHTFGQGDGENVKFFAPIEATINMKEAFKDDPILYAKVKTAIFTSHEKKGYPDFCVLVGKRISWLQFYVNFLNSFVSLSISFAVLIMYFLENMISMVLSVISLLSPWFERNIEVRSINFNCSKNLESFFNRILSYCVQCDMLYTPCRVDNQLFKRRLKNIVSQEIKNSRWPFDSWSKSWKIQKTLKTGNQLRGVGDETVLLLPICEKEENMEIRQLKIVLIFKRDLKACKDIPLENIQYDLGYKFWETRVKHLREWSEIYADPPNEYDLGKYWTDIKVPEFPEFFFASRHSQAGPQQQQLQSSQEQQQQLSQQQQPQTSQLQQSTEEEQQSFEQQPQSTPEQQQSSSQQQFQSSKQQPQSPQTSQQQQQKTPRRRRPQQQQQSPLRRSARLLRTVTDDFTDSS
jgi:hypothetical protein